MASTSGAADIKAVEREIKDVGSAIRKTEDEISETRDEIKVLAKKLHRLDAQLDSIGAKLDSIDAKLLSPSLTESQRAELRTEQRQLRTEQQQLRTEQQQLRDKQHQLRVHQHDLNTNMQQLRDKEHQLRVHQHDLNTNMQQLRDKEHQLRDQQLQMQQGLEAYLERTCNMDPPSRTSLSQQQDSRGPLINNWRPTAAIAGGQLPELIHPVFAKAVDILKGSTTVDKETITAAAKLCRIGAEIHEKEPDLTGAVQDLLMPYLAGIGAEPVGSAFASSAIPDWALCNSSTDPTNLFLVLKVKVGIGGSGDSQYQGANYHVHFWRQRTDSLIFKKTCCPAFLLEVVGPHLRLSAMAWVDRVTVFPLTPLLNLLEAHPDTDCLLMPVARLLAALREGVRELAETYAKTAPLQQPTVRDRWGLPWPIRLNDRYNAMSAMWLAPRNPTYCVHLAAAGSSGEGGGASGAAGTASASSAGGTGGAACASSAGASKVVQVKVVVKLCRKYGLEAHRAWADIGLAPQVLLSEQLPGGWLLVEMEWLPQDDWCRLSDLRGEECNKALCAATEALKQAHTRTGMVHGDARPPNCLVRRDPEGADSWQVRFVDFEWAGREGEATYPACLNPDIPWPMGVDYGQKLQAAHDLELLAASTMDMLHQAPGKRQRSEASR